MPRNDDVHELGNQLAVALAIVEAMCDGVVAPTAARLEALADALRGASDSLRAWRTETK
jgi:hypothetical protein